MFSKEEHNLIEITREEIILHSPLSNGVLKFTVKFDVAKAPEILVN